MKKLDQPLMSLLLFSILLLIISCKKDNTNSNLISNNYNKNISSASKAIDTVSVDLDNDGVRDIRLICTNNQYSIVFQPAKLKIIQVERLTSNIEFSYTLQYSNYANGFRQYNFGNGSLYLFYAKSFSSGTTIDSLQSFAGSQYYCTSNYAFNNSGSFSYNESVGNFLNATGYLIFRLNKSDGRHYGWINISNSNNCMDAMLISSAFSVQPNQSIKIK